MGSTEYWPPLSPLLPPEGPGEDVRPARPGGQLLPTVREGGGQSGGLGTLQVANITQYCTMHSLTHSYTVFHFSPFLVQEAVPCPAGEGGVSPVQTGGEGAGGGGQEAREGDGVLH